MPTDKTSSRSIADIKGKSIYPNNKPKYDVKIPNLEA